MTKTTMRLAELTQAFDAYYRDVEANDGEETPELAARHECLVLDTAQKVDGYIFRLHAFEGLIEEKKKLERELRESRQHLEREVERLELRVWEHMTARGIEELPGEVFKGFKTQPAGGSLGLDVIIADPDAWPTHYWKPPQVDEAKVRADLLAEPAAGVVKLGHDVMEPNGKTVRYAAGTVLARLKPRGKVLRRYV